MTLVVALLALVGAGARSMLIGLVVLSVYSVISGVQRARRVRRKLREEKRRARAPFPHPGALVDFVPRAWPGFAAPTHLRSLAEAIELSVRETVEIAFSVPVRHGKTTLLVAAVVWLLIVKPDAQILYVSYAHGFAAKQVSRAMAICRLLGVPLGDTQRKDEFTTAWGGRVKAVGIRGQITGEGFSHIFVDDPHKNRLEAESPIIREATIEAFWNDIYTRQIPSGTSVFIVHARWHVNDLIGSVSRATKPIRYLNLPALTWRGAVAVALAPWMWAAEKLLEIKAKLGPYVWASLYDGTPQPRGGTLFKEAVLAVLDALQARGQAVTCIGIDLARTARTRSDHHAAVVMRKSPAPPGPPLKPGGPPRLRWFCDIVDAIAVRAPLTDQKSESGELIAPGFARDLAKLAQKYPGARIAWYSSPNEEWLAESLQNATNEILLAAGARPIRITLMPIVSRDKYLRAQSWGSTWNAGLVRVLSVEKDHASAEHIDALIAQHNEFTGVDGNADDLVDAAVAAHDDLFDIRPGAPTPSGNSTPARTEGDVWGDAF